MSLIERKLEPREVDRILDKIEEYEQELTEKVPNFFYAILLGLFITIILVGNYPNTIFPFVISCIVFVLYAFFLQQFVQANKENLRLAEKSIQELKSILREEKIQVKRHEFRRAIALNIRNYVFYLLETKDDKILIRKHFIFEEEEYYPFSLIDFYQNPALLSKHLGETYQELGNIPIIQKLYSNHEEIIELLGLEQNKILYKKLEGFLKDYEKAAVIMANKEKEEEERWAKLSVEEAKAELQESINDALRTIKKFGKKD